MKKILSKSIIITTLTTTLFVVLFVVVFAVDTTNCAPTSGEGIKYCLLAPFGETKGVTTFSSYLAGAIPFILRMAAVFAVVQIVIGGFQYAVSEAMGQKQDAKDRMTQAMIGLVLALTSYLILNTINPNLVNLDIGIQPVRIEGTKLICPTSDGKPCPQSEIQTGGATNNWTLQTKATAGGWESLTGVANNGSLNQADCQTLLNALNDNNNYQCSPFSGQGKFTGSGSGGTF